MFHPPPGYGEQGQGDTQFHIIYLGQSFVLEDASARRGRRIDQQSDKPQTFIHASNQETFCHIHCSPGTVQVSKDNMLGRVNSKYLTGKPRCVDCGECREGKVETATGLRHLTCWRLDNLLGPRRSHRLWGGLDMGASKVLVPPLPRL